MMRTPLILKFPNADLTALAAGVLLEEFGADAFVLKLLENRIYLKEDSMPIREASFCLCDALAGVPI